MGNTKEHRFLDPKKIASTSFHPPACQATVFQSCSSKLYLFHMATDSAVNIYNVHLEFSPNSNFNSNENIKPGEPDMYPANPSKHFSFRGNLTIIPTSGVAIVRFARSKAGGCMMVGFIGWSSWGPAAEGLSVGGLCFCSPRGRKSANYGESCPSRISMRRILFLLKRQVFSFISFNSFWVHFEPVNILKSVCYCSESFHFTAVCVDPFIFK